jgi:putative transposase
MAQKPRDTEPGIHHFVVGATGPSDYYRDHIDRLDWLRRFIRTLDRYGWSCLLFCQMTTHVHALVDVPDRSLSEGMQRLNGGYGREFNERHGRSGALIRRRFWSTRMQSEEQLLAAFRYAALNPVRARMCGRAEEWYWSSVATSCGLATTFPFVDTTAVMSALRATTDDFARALLALCSDV